MWVGRDRRGDIEQLIQTRPAVMLTGARQTGKSSLLRQMFPETPYVTLDRPWVAMEAEESPERFLGQFSGQVIIDEIQYAPGLFRQLKILIDEKRDLNGRFILTGSQQFSLMEKASESLAGRIGILHLYTLSARELRESGDWRGDEVERLVVRGGYPELWRVSTLDAEQFFGDYIQTYLEKDLQAIIHVRNLRDFQRFIRLIANQVGQLLNFSEIARGVGVAQGTIKHWCGAMEASGLISLLPPYFVNIGKRLVKVPKLYFNDSGLLCHLLNVGSQEGFHRHPLRGHLWENFVFSELIKADGATVGKNLFFYRDQNGVEMDFLLERDGGLDLIEAKSTEGTGRVSFAKVAKALAKAPMIGFTCNHLACLMREEHPIHLADHRLYNPLRHAFREES